MSRRQAAWGLLCCHRQTSRQLAAWPPSPTVVTMLICAARQPHCHVGARVACRPCCHAGAHQPRDPTPTTTVFVTSSARARSHGSMTSRFWCLPSIARAWTLLPLLSSTLPRLPACPRPSTLGMACHASVVREMRYLLKKKLAAARTNTGERVWGMTHRASRARAVHEKDWGEDRERGWHIGRSCK